MSSSAAERLPDDESGDSRSPSPTCKPDNSSQLSGSSGNSDTAASGRDNQQRTISVQTNHADKVAQDWLDAQCNMINGTLRGIVFKTPANQTDLQAIAVLKKSDPCIPARLVDTAESALVDNTVATASGDVANTPNAQSVSFFIAIPLLHKGNTRHVAAFELPDQIGAQKQAIIQLLQWGGGVVRSDETGATRNYNRCSAHNHCRVICEQP